MIYASIRIIFYLTTKEKTTNAKLFTKTNKDPEIKRTISTYFRTIVRMLNISKHAKTYSFELFMSKILIHIIPIKLI